MQSKPSGVLWCALCDTPYVIAHWGFCLWACRGCDETRYVV